MNGEIRTNEMRSRENIDESREKEGRDLKEVAKKNDVYFLHGITDTTAHVINSPVSEKADTKERLKIVLGLAPDISAHTCWKDSERSNFWSSVGVVLNGGSIEYGSTSDVASSAKGLKSDRIPGFEPKNSINEINKAAQSRSDSYNEFGVKDPGIAGVYVLLGKQKDHGDRRYRYDEDDVFEKLKEDDGNPENFLSYSNNRGIPIYGFKDGLAYRCITDEKTGEYKWDDDPTLPEEMVDKNFNIDTILKSQIEEELINDFPFKIEVPEKNEYLEFGKGKKIGSLISAMRNYLKDNSEFKVVEDKRYKKVSKTSKVGNFEEEILATDDNFYHSNTDTYGNNILSEFEHWTELREFVTNEIYNPEEIKSWSVKYYEFKQGNISFEEYLKWVMDEISSNSILTKTVGEEVSKKLASKLYGLAKGLENNGFKEDSENLKDVADTGYSKEDFEDMLKRRTREDGKFKFTKEDLE